MTFDKTKFQALLSVYDGSAYTIVHHDLLKNFGGIPALYLSYLISITRLQDRDDGFVRVTTGKIAETFGSSRSAVFRELKKLKEDGLIESKRVLRKAYYRVCISNILAKDPKRKILIDYERKRSQVPDVGCQSSPRCGTLTVPDVGLETSRKPGENGASATPSYTTIKYHRCDLSVATRKVRFRKKKKVGPSRYFRWAKRLHRSINKVRKLKTSNLKTWENDIRKIVEVDGQEKEEVSKLLKWYCRQIEKGDLIKDNRFLPVAYCGRKFREKYTNIEMAFYREQKKRRGDTPKPIKGKLINTGTFGEDDPMPWDGI